MSAEILAFAPARTNAELIEQVAQLGYITGRTLDLTYGVHGGFWARWRPAELVTNDLYGAVECDHHEDFCRTGFEMGSFETVVFDPPYKLNGTPGLAEMDGRFGVGERATRRDRMASIVQGTVEACRLSSRWVLVKCKDQVNGGRVRWQRDIVTQAAWAMEFEKVDDLPLEAHVPQPGNRSQQHAARNFSSLLIFKMAPR